MDMYRYALGYVNKNNSCRSHKVLRFIDHYISSAVNHAPENRFSWYEIYDIETDLWTTLDVPPYWIVSCYQRGVSLKGNTYFCATKSNAINKIDDHIICFDFTSERFGPLLRLPFSAGHDDYVTLSCVREEKLAALLTHNDWNPYEFEIWITTKIEYDKVSWSKILEMDTGPLADMPIAYIHGSFFIDEEKKVSMVFDHHRVNIIGKTGYFRELDLRVHVAGIKCRPHLCPYVPNSMQIKQPPGGKRKRKPILEQRRYDQNMLRVAAFIKRTKQEDNKWKKRVLEGLKKQTNFKA
ncbi:putative galactose oxidase/kelch, beta-propeller, F-box associated interaction [Arabidopsis thaliana]|uniref:F-box associated beta-propeller type 1 domain-containing protein n=4 Tax=Arabidopsis TaxID=3701 RepID=A0A178V9B4_ARATH|nr:F-box associated domain type 1 [Arabidopsis suecica]OAP02258.1 hypothetical protein AXX17_AT3G03680 [Arabidopsis thaliana]